MHRFDRLVPALFALALAGCTVGLDEVECTSDADCTAPNVCLAGACGPATGGGDVGTDVDPDAIGDGGTDTGGDGGADVGDAGGDTPTCAVYCRQITDTCTGENAQYASEESCLDLCAGYGWPAGSIEVDDDNTIGCRTKHAQYAALAANDGEAAQVAAHCRHAGPTGGDVCGRWCDVYCEAALHICETDPLYEEIEECRGVCEGISDEGLPGDTVGNSVQCRIYHLGAASDGGVAEVAHCPHASVESTPDTCGDPVPGECGDGTIDEGEECDDGEDNADEPDACRTNCNLPFCGDKIVDSDEVCDIELQPLWCTGECDEVDERICEVCAASDDTCGEDFVCAALSGAAGVSLCVPECETSAECPNGFACEPSGDTTACIPANRDACEAIGRIEICDNMVDDDGDGLSDCDDPQCSFEDVCAAPAEVCDNGEDDDDDDFADCEDEDCNDDPACIEPPCVADRAIGSRVGTGVGSFIGREFSGDNAAGTCSPSGLEDIVIEWVAPTSGEFFISIDASVSTFVHVHELVCDGPERGCTRDGSAAPVFFTAREGETIAIVVESDSSSFTDTQTFSLNIGRPEDSTARCGNGFDDDLDGDTDCRDTECASLRVCSGSGFECASDRECGEGENCSDDGLCVCDEGLDRCDDACIDTAEDFFNCGACGTSCEPGQACERGTCVDAEAACRCTAIVQRYCSPGEGDCTDPEGCCATSLTGCRSIEVLCSEE